jgi:phospholipid/cholesterol/gamma-HCH transport system substrate-binding protein
MTREQRVGLFVILALIIFVVFLELTTGFMPFERAYTVYGSFQNVRGVQEGTDVAVSGMNVGKVKRLSFKDGKVELAMVLPQKVRLYQDAKARIEVPMIGPTASMNITPGSPKKSPLKNGDHIDTEESPSIQEVLGRVDKAVASLDDWVESFRGEKGPFAQLNTFFKEHEKEMGKMVENFSKFSERLAEGKGTLGKLMEDDTL